MTGANSGKDSLLRPNARPIETTPLVSTSLWPSLVPSRPKGLVVCVIPTERSFAMLTKHFAELFGGELCEGVPEAHRCCERSPEEKRWLAEITAPWNNQKHLAAVSRGRAAEPDFIPIELIVAGGLPWKWSRRF